MIDTYDMVLTPDPHPLKQQRSLLHTPLSSGSCSELSLLLLGKEDGAFLFFVLLIIIIKFIITIIINNTSDNFEPEPKDQEHPDPHGQDPCDNASP